MAGPAVSGGHRVSPGGCTEYVPKFQASEPPSTASIRRRAASSLPTRLRLQRRRPATPAPLGSRLSLRPGAGGGPNNPLAMSSLRTSGLPSDRAVDDELRTAVEAAFEPDAGEGAGASMSARSSAPPAPPEPTDPAAPRTVALPEPEGAPVVDDGEEVVAPVEGATTVRLVGLAGGVGGPRVTTVVCVAA